jgi:diketogulonate reductase-like aldo/keto reductase
LGATVAHLAIAWVAKNPRMSSVIMGASSVKQLEDNLDATDLLPKLTPDVRAQVDEITAGLAEIATGGAPLPGAVHEAQMQKPSLFGANGSVVPEPD